MLKSHMGKILQPAQEQVSKMLTLRSTGAIPKAPLLLCVHVHYQGQKESDVFLFAFIQFRNIRWEF